MSWRRCPRLVWQIGLSIVAVFLLLPTATPIARGVGLDGPAGSAGLPQLTAAVASPLVPGRLVVKLRPRAGRRAADGMRRGFAAAMGDAEGRAFDDLVAKHRATRMRRAFQRLEDAQGNLRATASQRAAQSRLRHAARTARRRSAGPAPKLEDVYLLDVDASADVRRIAAEFRRLAAVEYAEPEMVYRANATPLPALPYVPDDRFVTQDGVHWSEGAWGQAFFDLWGIDKVGAIPAWNEFDVDDSGAFETGETRPGEGIVIAILDSGIDVLHPDIAANVWTNPGETPGNGIDDDGNGYVDDVAGWDFVEDDNDPTDPFGHGSHVAGTAAGTGNNTLGVIGVAPFAKVMNLRGLGDQGSGSNVDLAAAILYAADNGADILSNSWGGGPSDLIRDAFDYAESVGAVSVASAGNASNDVRSQSPANLGNVIAVAALRPDDTKAGFSNYGTDVDVSAPGTEILSLNAHGGANAIAAQVPANQVETDYLQIGGTSMSCPHVSGALAVLMGIHPGENAAELRGRLRAGARDVDGVNPGFEGLLGAGALDLPASLAAVPQPLLEIERTEPTDLPLGGAVSLVVHVHNFWAQSSGVSGTLTTSDPLVAIQDGSASFGDIPLDETRSNQADPFQLTVDPNIVPGTLVEFELALSGAGYMVTHPIRMSAPIFADTTASAGLPDSGFIPFHVNFLDYDGDDLTDVLTVTFNANVVFRNLGNGTFEDAQAATGIPSATFGTLHSLLFDADNDGDRDLALGNSAGSYFYENLGDGSFADRSLASGLSTVPMSAMTAADYDGDGFADLFSGYLGGLVLLKNGGDGTFTDVTAETGFDGGYTSIVSQILAVDYDDDGDVDVFAVDDSSLVVLRNDGDGTWSEPPENGIVRDQGFGPDAIAAGDYDGDGDLDLFVTGRGTASENAPNELYRNDGDGTFTDVIDQAGDLASDTTFGWMGTDFFDYDNDGDLDLFLVSQTSTPHHLFRNEGDGTFTLVDEVAFPAGFRPSFAAAGIADYDGDGSLDLYAPDGGAGGLGRGGLLRNQFASSAHSIRVDLDEGRGDPFGARVRVVADGRVQVREVHHAGVEYLPLHFGLGDATSVDRIEITWPDGTLQRIGDVAADQTIRVERVPGHCAGHGDADQDGTDDSCDNCPGVWNAWQTDTDSDGVGDLCGSHLDADLDGWSDTLDVCPGFYDPRQEDADGDGVGDACTPAVHAPVPAAPPWALVVAFAALAAAAGWRLRAR